MWNKQYNFSSRSTQIHQELPCEFWSILHGHMWSQLGKEYFLLFPLGPDNGVVPRGLAQSDAWYWGLVLSREGTSLFSVEKLDVSWLHCSKPRQAWLHLGLSLSPVKVRVIFWKWCCDANFRICDQSSSFGYGDYSSSFGSNPLGTISFERK